MASTSSEKTTLVVEAKAMTGPFPAPALPPPPADEDIDDLDDVDDLDEDMGDGPDED